MEGNTHDVQMLSNLHLQMSLERRARLRDKARRQRLMKIHGFPPPAPSQCPIACPEPQRFSNNPPPSISLLFLKPCPYSPGMPEWLARGPRGSRGPQEAAGAPGRSGHSSSELRAEISGLRRHPRASPFLILHLLLGMHRKHQK